MGRAGVSSGEEGGRWVRASFCFCLVLVAVLDGGVAESSTGRRLLVLGLKADPADATLVSQIQPELVSALQKTGYWSQILVASDMGMLVEYDELRGLSGCNDDDCRTRLDKVLKDVDELVAGSLKTTSDGHRLDIVRLDARTMGRLLGPGPSEPLKTIAELKNYARDAAHSMAVSVLPPAVPKGRILVAVPDLNDLTKAFSSDAVEQLSVVFHTALSGGSVFALYPRDRLNLIREQMKDPTAVLRVSRAELLLEAEVVKKDEACAVTARIYDAQSTGVSQFGGAVGTSCDQAGVGRALEEMADKIEARYTRQGPERWPIWLSGAVAVAGGTVGGIFLKGAFDDIERRNGINTSESGGTEAWHAADQDAREKVTGVNVAFGVAGAALLMGAVFVVRELFFVDSDPEPAPGTTMPGSLGWKF